MTWEQAGKELAAGAQALERAGAELIAITANTMHLVADQVSAAVDIPLIHLMEVAAEAAVGADLHTLGLRGDALHDDVAPLSGRL